MSERGYQERTGGAAPKRGQQVSIRGRNVADQRERTPQRRPNTTRDSTRDLRENATVEKDVVGSKSHIWYPGTFFFFFFFSWRRLWLCSTRDTPQPNGLSKRASGPSNSEEPRIL